jgi:hypothetical protein
MTMDWGTAAQWGGVFLSLTALLVAWLNRRTDAIKSLEKRVEGHDADLREVKSELAHLPSKDLTGRLELGLERLNGRLDTLGATLTPVAQISNRLQEFLLEQAARK